MTYQDALGWLDGLTNFEKVRDAKRMREICLTRMQRLCRLLGDPQRRFRAVIVTGTNGKGSVCAMLYSMLRAGGFRAGLYTSPHLEHPRERIRTTVSRVSDGEPPHRQDWITEEELAAAVAELQPAVEALAREAPEAPPTYFEVMTALAFLHFAKAGVELAVLEVGLGGRLDATNVIDQAVSVIGPIDLEHTEVLGTTLARIAEEKAGIIKSAHPVIAAAQQPGVLEVLRAASEAAGATLYVVGQDVTTQVLAHDLEGLVVTVTGLRGIYEGLRLPMLGRHQAENAALAIAALEALSPDGAPSTMIDQGLATVEWPGRIDVVHEQPLVIVDGAHNPHASQALAATLQELCPGRSIHVLLGISSDKAAEALGRMLGPLAVSVTCTRSRHPRAMAPEALAARISPWCREVHVMPDAADALTWLLNSIPADHVILVAGSLFLAGELRAAFRQAHVRVRSARNAEALAA